MIYRFNMKKTFFAAALAVLVSCISLQAKSFNRYGMKLVEKGGKTCVADSATFDKIGIKWRTLPAVLTPYKPENTVFDKKSVSSVVPDTLIYKKNVAGQELPLLVYHSGAQNAPVVFLIHGGGWISGSFKASSAFCKTLAGKYGITVVSIEYTFASAQGARMEDTIQDCYDAVGYVLSQSARFGIDPQRIGFMGSSAGGHLSACCALHFPQTRALAGWYGAYDLIHTISVYAPKTNPKKRSAYIRYFNGVKDLDDDYLKSCSPHVMARGCNTGFKAILFEGTADITIGAGNAETFRQVLYESGNSNVEVHSFNNVTHSMFSSYAADEIYLSTLNLFLSTL